MKKLIDMQWAIWRAWEYNLKPRAVWRKLRKFWQRGRRGWADEDVWSLDDYLTDIIIGGVKKLCENPNGYPSYLYQENGENNSGVERWQAILREIIIGFEARKRISNLDYDWRNKEEEARLTALADRGMALFVEYYGALWD